MFEQPLELDTSHTEARRTPDSWKKSITAEEIRVLPIAGEGVGGAGWCTNGYCLENLPDVEVMCGGRNSKGPNYAAVWRQGHLLHFGFEPDPAQMNEFGQGLLENSICYIANFTGARPIGRSSKSSRPDWMRARYISDRLVLHGDPGKWIHSLFAPEIVARYDEDEPEAFRTWYREHRGYLYAAPKQKYVVDRDVVAMGVPFDELRFLARCIELFNDGEHAVRARALLHRFVADPLGEDAPQAAWQKWLTENRDFLYFYDGGFYLWHIDPLAKRRGIPTAELRGASRADPAETRAEKGPIAIRGRWEHGSTTPERLSFVLDVRLQPGWHIYAGELPKGSFSTASRLEFELPEGLEAKGKWQHPRPDDGNDGDSRFSGIFSLRQELQCGPELQPGALLRCKLHYQACDPMMCQMPETLSVELRVPAR